MSESNGNLAIAMTAGRLAEADAARMAELTAIEKKGRICRHCGHRLSDYSLQKHPGVCSKASCRMKAARDALGSPPADALPAKDPPMPEATTRTHCWGTEAPPETLMSTKPVKQLCDCGCGKPLRADNKTGRRAQCVARLRKEAAAKGRSKAERPAPAPRKATAGRPGSLSQMSVEELVSLRDQVGEQLRARLDAIDADRAAIREALGAAVG